MFHVKHFIFMHKNEKKTITTKKPQNKLKKHLQKISLNHKNINMTKKNQTFTETSNKRETSDKSKEHNR